MSLSVLVFTIILPIPFCIFRRKKYALSWRQMIIVYVVTSIVGAVGACIGSVMGGGSIWGIRLYGLMLFDSIGLIVGSFIFCYKIGEMGDFISVPIMVVCSSSKIHCLIINCCKGIILYTTEAQEAVRFPSQILETIVWAMLALYLLLLERKNWAKNILWPIAMIWFGVLRYLVDFLRAATKDILFFNVTLGQFWSLTVCIFGLVWLYITMRKKLGRSPKFPEYCKAIVGHA